jgi:hypothetical protein
MAMAIIIIFIHDRGLLRGWLVYGAFLSIDTLIYFARLDLLTAEMNCFVSICG